jgi:WD40 repeat protein
MAHTRPISSIVFSPDRMTLATASWDRSITIWSHLQEREGRTLLGHQDIVAGCRFTPEGNRLLSWSHDGTVRVWDPTSGLCLSVLKGHRDRVTAAAISPDGSLAASGSRDQALKLWNLAQFSEERSVRLEAEIRGCFFLLDGESLMTADARGQLQLFTLPDLQPGGELLTRLPVQCGDLSPQGQTLAVGCGDGRVRLVAVEGLDGAPLLVMPTRTTRQVQNRLERLFGRRRLVHAYSCTCPRCRQSFEVSGSSLGQAADCPNCQRPIRVSPVARLQNEN